MTERDGEQSMSRDDVVVLLSTALFGSWFPNGHFGAWMPEFQEDFDNWVDCAMADSQTVLAALEGAGLLSFPDSAMVDPMTKDERNT